MWTRREVKEKGRAALKANYWMTVIVSLIMLVCIGSTGTAAGSNGKNRMDVNTKVTQDELERARMEIESDASMTAEQKKQALALVDIAQSDELTRDQLGRALSEFGVDINDSNQMEVFGVGLLVAAGIILGAILIAFIIAKLIDIFLLNPLEIGCRSFFIKNLTGQPEIGEIKAGFLNYGRNVGAMLLRDIFIILWTCLFVFPGIIKMYSYRMVPFILAEHPEYCGLALIRYKK